MTEKERRFCREYAVDRNARAAAIRAGYSPATARNAWEWLRTGNKRFRPEIWRVIMGQGETVGEAADAAKPAGGQEITMERVMQEYARIAFASIADIKEIRQQLEGSDNAAAIASVKFKSGASTTDCDVHMYDKMKALDVLRQHLGMAPAEEMSQDGMPRIIAFPDGSVEIGEGRGIRE